MLTKELNVFRNFIANLFHCGVQEGQEDFIHFEDEGGEDDILMDMDDVPFIRFDGWLTVYHHENNFFVHHLISAVSHQEMRKGGLDTYGAFRTNEFYQALEYAGFRMMELECANASDMLKNMLNEAEALADET